MHTKIDYGINRLVIGDYPKPNIIPYGTHIGTPCLEFITGELINTTNQDLREVVNSEYPLTNRILIRGDKDPTICDGLWSYIKYHNDTSEKRRIWQIITNGDKYDVKFLYNIDHIIINVQVPSTGKETPPEFISWCGEDKILQTKIEFVFSVTCSAEDINYARYEIPKLSTYKRPITIIPSYWNKEETQRQFKICEKNNCLQVFEEQQAQPYGWKSYLQFAEAFVDTLRYPKVRLHPDLQRIFGLKS